MADPSAVPSLSTLPSGEPRIKPVWCFRVLPALALVSLLLAQTVLRSGNWHDFCLGFPTGLLIALIAVSFSVEEISFRRGKERSDVTVRRITS